jgi:hypothetical protein
MCENGCQTVGEVIDIKSVGEVLIHGVFKHI